MNTFNPSNWEAKAGNVCEFEATQSEFQDSQSYTEKPCLEKPKKGSKSHKMIIISWISTDIFTEIVYVMCVSTLLVSSEAVRQLTEQTKHQVIDSPCMFKG